MVAPAAVPAENSLQTLNIVKELLIDAPMQIAWDAILAEVGPEGQMPDGKPFPLKFEAWPGGRWYRDLGNDTGHFWGHVQVIKPPGLLEICGPMFMSFAAMNHIQYRLMAEGERTRMKFTHRSIGEIPEDFRLSVGGGWEWKIKRIGEIAARLKGAK